MDTAVTAGVLSASDGDLIRLRAANSGLTWGDIRRSAGAFGRSVRAQALPGAVKAEYRALTGQVPGGVRVFTIGEDGGLPLRINPFVPVDSVPLLRHIDLLKAVFNASFPMYAGMPYVLEEAMLRIYQERGWNLNTSVNRALGPHPAPEDRDALVPSLVDLHDKIEDVLRDRKYGEEIHQNMGAALVPGCTA
ncbi:hypothetical protein ALI144C_37280 [Actinosynnema sp. ALI-1.44]|uniref:hypothetical protein n=1 Tax=Actinosynnema sp. ALI-1.44 TaxID=1933779 RepID=UPI00097C8F52|nr:hypothetical protein [Actinosynnema sp. ALI-1.44]ONI76313.1 hypothetical protein ALI144C_37280 [Actinosynnema sp. ALI-1.44]